MTNQEIYQAFIENVCKKFHAEDAIKPLTEGLMALEESRRMYAGKTLRDQNNFDRKIRNGWKRPDLDDTKTLPDTTRKYGFRKTVSAGKGGDQYGLAYDGMASTGKNTGLAKTSRREIKRKENVRLDKDMQDQLSDMNTTSVDE